MRRTLFAFTLLTGLAGGVAASPAHAAPLAHGLLPSPAALLLASDAPATVLDQGAASVQEVQYYRHRHYRRYYRHGRYYRR